MNDQLTMTQYLDLKIERHQQRLHSASKSNQYQEAAILDTELKLLRQIKSDIQHYEIKVN